MKPKTILVGKRVSVFEVDHAATGKAARSMRQAAGLSVRQLAQRMFISASYLSDLELGRRRWHAAIAARFVTACDTVA